MFQKMRRSRQELTLAESEEILLSGREGVLALAGADGYPYAVPLNYVYADGKIYFHVAKEGHKTDCIRHSDKASFCVVSEGRIVPEEYTTYFKSAIAFGRIGVVSDEEEKRRSLYVLTEKYAPAVKEEGVDPAAMSCFPAVTMLRFDVERLSGKQAKELI